MPVIIADVIVYIGMNNRHNIIFCFSVSSTCGSDELNSIFVEKNRIPLRSLLASTCFWQKTSNERWRYFLFATQCNPVGALSFDIVGWATGRAFGLWKTRCWYFGSDVLTGALNLSEFRLWLYTHFHHLLLQKNPRWLDILVPA